MVPTVKERLAAANRHIEANLPEAAEEVFRDVLQVEPQNSAAMAGLGAVLLQRGLMDEAFEALGRATSLDPKNAEPYRNLAVAYRLRNENENALVCLEAALSIEPDRIETLVTTGETLVAVGRRDESIAMVEKAHRLDPQSVPALIALGGLHTLGNDFAKAIACYQRALAIAPETAEAHANLAVLYATTGRPKEALDHAERAVLAEPLNPIFVATLAGALEEIGEIDRAVAMVRRMLVLHPQVIPLHCRLASLQLSGGAIDEALAGIARLLREQRSEPALLETMTQLLYRAGRPQQALAAARELMNVIPDAAIARRVEHHSLFLLGRHDEVWPARAAAATDGGEPARLEGARILARLDEAVPVLDALPLLRAVPILRARGADVRLLAPAFLAPLGSCLPDAGATAPNEASAEENQAWLEASEKISLTSLPDRFALGDDVLMSGEPFLVAPADKAAMWREALAAMPRPLVGFTWAPHKPGPRIEDIRRLLATTGGTAVSLVWDQNRPQLSLMPEAIDAGLHIKGLDDLVAATSALDAVVGIDGLPLHVAGGLGLPGVAVVPQAQLWYWRLGDDGHGLWYPSIRVVERAPGTPWESAEPLVADALAAALEGADARDVESAPAEPLDAV
ncbi:tetratricopeptide repeat protein [Amorphus coralli]|uniref:tetratricopeptide repeat protein n=1 Tax=Amorphus coralli TaxID=340680 RepID=UPI00037C7C3A|nr:tetratricopeptide repeat protein [Amorphus coralli]